MKKAILSLSFVFSAVYAAAPAARAADAGKANQLTKEEKKAGWKLLFDGSSLKGWRGYKKPAVPEGWQVVEGAITRVGKAGDLITSDQYKDFELAIEYNIAERGNSGIMYHVVEGKGAPYESGPEMQVADPKNGDGSSPLTSAGACYALYPVKKDVAKPGAWNQARLLVRGSHVEHWLNGEKVTEYELGSDDWKAKVAASKFGKMPDFGTQPTGFIDLQDHGDKVQYRNIKIRVLADKPSKKSP